MLCLKGQAWFLAPAFTAGVVFIELSAAVVGIPPIHPPHLPAPSLPSNTLPLRCHSEKISQSLPAPSHFSYPPTSVFILDRQPFERCIRDTLPAIINNAQQLHIISRRSGVLTHQRRRNEDCIKQVPVRQKRIARILKTAYERCR